MNIFHRRNEDPPEEAEPAAAPPPLPATPSPSPKLTRITLTSGQLVELTRALRPKIAHVLKDLSLDGAGLQTPAVVGGAGKPASVNSRSSGEAPFGPIV